MQQAEQEAPQDMPAVAAAAAESSAIVSSSDHDHPVASSAAGGRGAASAAAAAYDSSDDEVGHPGGSGNGGDPLPDPHYDENQDEEDEAWVYRHMRGGRAEEVMMAVQSTRASTRTRRKAREDEQETTKNGGGETLDAAICGNANDSRRQQQQQQQQQRSPAQDRAGARPAPPDMAKVMMLKPRNSDAVLSCPCCFTIVCMDCQRHVKYNNQYRAMFVMNIGVAWHKRLRWDEYLGELVEIIGANDASGGADERTMELDSPSDIPNAVPGDSCDEGQPSQKSVEDDPADIKTKTSAGNTRASRTRAHLEGDDETYYSVYCASCNTEVAYLNMDDEVYHFVNCLASG